MSLTCADQLRLAQAAQKRVLDLQQTTPDGPGGPVGSICTSGLRDDQEAALSVYYAETGELRIEKADQRCKSPTEKDKIIANRADHEIANRKIG